MMIEYQPKMGHPIRREKADAPAWKLTVDGLKGEYSTSYLKGADNAIRLCAEGVSLLGEKKAARLVSLNGGKEGGKVAAQCEAVFCSNIPEDELRSCFRGLGRSGKKGVVLW